MNRATIRKQNADRQSGSYPRNPDARAGHRPRFTAPATEGHEARLTRSDAGPDSAIRTFRQGAHALELPAPRPVAKHRDERGGAAGIEAERPAGAIRSPFVIVITGRALSIVVCPGARETEDVLTPFLLSLHRRLDLSDLLRQAMRDDSREYARELQLPMRHVPCESTLTPVTSTPTLVKISDQPSWMRSSSG